MKDIRQVLVSKLIVRFLAIDMRLRHSWNMNKSSHECLFSLGQTVMTPGAQKTTTDEERHAFLARHVAGDWGDVCAEDAAANDRALKESTRVLSSYTAESRKKIWVITEADRSSTTMLLPEEY